MKVLNIYTYEPVLAEPDPVSLTVPGQVFSLEELLLRYASGLSLTDNGNYLYDGDSDPDSLDFDNDDDIMLKPDLDLVDVYEHKQRFDRRLDVLRRGEVVSSDEELSSVDVEDKAVVDGGRENDSAFPETEVR